MKLAMSDDVRERLPHIRLVALDVDGVMTDGGLVYGEDGEAMKRFHAHDGLGIQLLLEAGIEVAVISARASRPLVRRVTELGIRHFRPGTRNKLGALRELARELHVGMDQICYVGDDLLDVPALRAVGFAVSLADSHPVAKEAAHWISPIGGGMGAVRRVADLILEGKQGLAAAYAGYLAREQMLVPGAQSPRFGVIIPARYASRRLPGKPLANIAGKPMILHVVENAQRSGASFVTVATDDQRIAHVVQLAGHHAVLTSSDHASGTDRLAEVVKADALGDDGIIVNVQGDEPMLDPSLIQAVAGALHAHAAAGMATVATPIRDASELWDPNVVKVMVDRDAMAMTFTRAPVPWVRDAFAAHEVSDTLPEGIRFLRHVGLYAYRAGVLRAIAGHPPVALEQAESLEQLRALWLGIRIHVTVADAPLGLGVDTESDLRKVRELFEQRAREARGGQSG